MHFNGFLRRGFIAAYYFRDYITTNLRLAASRNIPAPATLGDPRRFSGASMVPPKEEPEEGMTQEELNAAAADTTTTAPSEPRKKNACMFPSLSFFPFLLKGGPSQRSVFLHYQSIIA